MNLQCSMNHRYDLNQKQLYVKKRQCQTDSRYEIDCHPKGSNLPVDAAHEEIEGNHVMMGAAVKGHTSC